MLSYCVHYLITSTLLWRDSLFFSKQKSNRGPESGLKSEIVHRETSFKGEIRGVNVPGFPSEGAFRNISGF